MQSISFDIGQRACQAFTTMFSGEVAKVCENTTLQSTITSLFAITVIAVGGRGIYRLYHRYLYQTPLKEVNFFECAATGDLAAINKAIANKVDLNLQDDKTGNTLLHWAVINGYFSIVKILLENGANPEIFNKQGKTPLHLACESKSLENLDLLIEYGADINAQTKINKTVPLMHAINHANKKMIKMLLNSPGINLNIQDNKQQTALHICASRTDLREIVVLFLEAGANANIPDAQGRLPLHCIADNLFDRPGSFVATKCLLEKTANCNQQDNDGNTPVCLAARSRYGVNETLKALIKHGVDLSIANDQQRTPLDYAVMAGNEDCIIIILETLAWDTTKEIEINGLSLIEWATLYGATKIKKFLNFREVHYKYNPENKERLMKGSYKLFVRKNFNKKYLCTVKVKEIREFREDLQSIIEGSKATIQQPQMLADFNEWLAQSLENGHCILENYLTSYMKHLTNLVKREIPFIGPIHPRHTYAKSVPPNYRWLFEREVSLKELEEFSEGRIPPPGPKVDISPYTGINMATRFSLRNNIGQV